MKNGHRGLLGLTTFLVAGQTLMIGLYSFLFAPMYFQGVDPEDEESAGGAPETALAWTAAAMAVGLAAVAANTWSVRRMTRAVRDRSSAARSLTTAIAVQVMVVAGAVRLAWLPAVAASLAVLLPLLLCRTLDRRTFGA
ncbi:hypothetical protein [Streptomyces sp. URMC 124]|uniref:hypothetical protein n=1 Tax=Streptomyces sp. URMC 124 TaxID=3423405 RepID=UPI003F1BAF16